ncbi:LacI family DNA-binding transcriptional regulator [Glaciecola petra]|uniref:LacI family DNA-binding transcriptional regulator n=1 Tax=Glaciecola petra TaxID=3075602 RepID=A0ABU2ZRJ1_9ALTE|nr:LacI family DNA-binding transcriptional regulator [Aestuariibacter sp. P117]MDT0595242.1 LacI family DNA-binding transcriptional regulator [Aestuariibacter sp. P117]
MAKVKLVDVAQRASVSKSTASQYINGRFDYMSKQTQERIRLAIKDLDYVPNPIARNLKSDKTKTIGVIVRDITGFDTSYTIRGVDDYCKAFGYNALIYNTDFDPETEAKSLEALYQMRVDGIIIASSGENNTLIRDYIDKGMPIVHVQLEHDGSEKNLILSDYRKAAFEATEYLIKLGHKRICFVTQAFKNVKSRNERYLGYVSALEKHNIPLDKDLIQYWQRETGFEHAPRSVLASNSSPTAFFTQHLAITTELLRHLNEESISIPEDVSIIGFDDIPMAEFFKVPITVVKQEPYSIGKEATKLLLENINDKHKHAQKIMIACSITERQSCKKYLLG